MMGPFAGEPTPVRRRIALVSTGGTIEMVASGRGIGMTDAHNPLPLDGNVIPTHVDLTHFRHISLPSPQITLDMMAGLITFIEKLASGGEFEGIVVTHGTDTLEESAFLADTCLDGGPAVVFTAAMRSLSEMGVDGPRNLRGALLAAANPEVHKLGVTVVLNDEIHAAGRVTKTYTSNVSSFSAEEEYSISVEDDEMIPENLDSLNNVVAYLSKKNITG